MSSKSNSKPSWEWVHAHPFRIIAGVAIASFLGSWWLQDQVKVQPRDDWIEQLTEARDSFKNDLALAHSEMATLKEQLEIARSTVREASDESSELKRQLEVARAAASEPTERVAAAEKERDEQAAKAEALQRELAVVEGRLAAANERIRSLEASAPRSAPPPAAAPASAQGISNSPGAVQAGRDVNVTNQGAAPSGPPANIDHLIALRQKGDDLFTSAKKLQSLDVPRIAAAVVAWERDVEPEVAKVSKAALNRFQSARGRRNVTMYDGRNAAYDATMDRLEFQIEALNSIIDGR